MSIELKKEVVMLNETTCQMNCEAFIEADLIVPDVKPDIIRILQVDANPVIMDKTVSQDKVMFEGRVDICIMYAADDNCVKCINTRQNFSHQVNNKDAAPDLDMDAYCTMNKMDYHLINSRKLSFNATVGIEFCLMREVEAQFPVGFEDDITYQAQHTPINAYVAGKQTNADVSVRETLEVPIGKPDIDEILKVDVKLSNKDVRITGNKAIVKGDLLCSTLYLCDMDLSTVQHIEHELGFTEIIDIPYCEENQNCDIDFTITMINYSIKQDSDGDNRLLFLEIFMDAAVKMNSTVKMNVLTDAYSTNSILDIKRKQVNLDEMVADLKVQNTFKSTANLPDNANDIVQIYNISANPNIAETKLENGQAQIEGDVDINILYESADPDKPVDSLQYKMPYNQAFDVEGANDKMYCEVNVDVDHISYNMSLANEVDVRCILGISMKVLKKYTADIIDDVEDAGELEPEKKSTYSIKIYFVQKGDSLWNICKNYKVTIDALLHANQMDMDAALTPGQQIIIP